MLIQGICHSCYIVKTTEMFAVLRKIKRVSRDQMLFYKLNAYLLHCSNYVKSSCNSSFELYLWEVLTQSSRREKSYLCLAKGQE